MSREQSTNTQRLESLPKLEPLVLGAMVVLVNLSFRADFHHWLILLWIEAAVLLSLPVLLFYYLTRTFSFEELKSPQWLYRIQAGAIVYSLLPILTQYILRAISIGDAYEVVMLTMVMNCAWYLAIFSRFATFERTSFIMGGALVLFVCFMSQQRAVYLYAFIYAIMALWWLFGTYWNRLSTKAIDGESQMLPLQGSAVIGSILILSLVGLIAFALGPSGTPISLKGFMPSSGGDKWSDAFARSGIGDGDMLTAGDNATTAGAVDSDQFIEDDRPAMYDITSEKYDGPARIKKKRNRSQALDLQAKHLHKVIQSEQSGRSFRTARESDKVKEMKLEDRITDALLFVEGPVPARLGVDCFHHFDGLDWTKVDLDNNGLTNPKIQMKRTLGKPWFVIKNLHRQFLESFRTHRVKFMRLDTNAVPAPPLMKSFHIHRVENETLFGWNAQGTVEMKSDSIPKHTMIDIVSEVPNYHILKSKKHLQLKDHPSFFWEQVDRLFGTGNQSGYTVGQYSPLEEDPDSPYVQVPKNQTEQRMKDLVAEWTKGYEEGWSQVAAINQRLRSEFEYDPKMVVSGDDFDTVGAFLDQRGGPAYMFATTAAQMLRTAGYRTRVMRGFLLDHDDYDRVARQSVVDSDNLHMWPEVCIDGWHWIPLEPTPGFPEPVNTMTAWQWLMGQIAMGYMWVSNHPLISFAFAACCGLAFWYRRQLVAFFGLARWWLTFICLPSKRLKATRQLLDTRFWAAGMPRPGFATIGHWYSQINETSQFNFYNFWQKESFSQRANMPEKKAVRSACEEIVSELSFKRIYDFAKSHKT